MCYPIRMKKPKARALLAEIADKPRRAGRSPLYVWMRENHTDLSADFRQNRPDWKVLAEAFALAAVERSLAAVESALATEEKLIATITAKNEEVTGADAQPDDLYSVGTLVMIKRMMRQDNTVQLIVQGQERIRVVEWLQTEPFLRARVEILPEPRVENVDEV